MEALRDYLDANLGSEDTIVVKLTRIEMESIISALDEVIAF